MSLPRSSGKNLHLDTFNTVSAVTNHESESTSQAATASDAAVDVWLLTNAPSPYQVELFAEIQKRREITLSVRFMQSRFRGDKANSALDGLQFKACKSIGLSKTKDELRIHPEIIKEAATHKANAFVLSGLYTSPTFLVCAMLLTLRRRPFYLWLERPSDGRHQSWARRLVRFPFQMIRWCLLNLLIRLSTGVICIGSRAAEQYARYGLTRVKTHILPYCCDVSRFGEVNDDEVTQLRKELALEPGLTFLFSGQLIHRKGVDRLLDAFRVVRENHDANLIILGDGEMRSELESQNIKGVRFGGYVDQHRLPVFFQASDVFVLPSRHDGWAVVVNEACGASLPVITTDRTGAAYDLVRDGESGFVVPADDVSSLVDAMRFFLKDPDAASSFGKRSLELVKPFDVRGGAKIFTQSVVS